MSKNILTYKGYSTRVEYSAADCVLHGKIEGIADLVNFESETVEGVEIAFHEAVDDYLAFCNDIGQEPDKEYKGSFNVRVDPKLHRELDRTAYKEGISMNQLIETALAQYIENYGQTSDMACYQNASNTPPVYVVKNKWKRGYEGSSAIMQFSPRADVLYSTMKN